MKGAHREGGKRNIRSPMSCIAVSVVFTEFMRAGARSIYLLAMKQKSHICQSHNVAHDLSRPPSAMHAFKTTYVARCPQMHAFTREFRRVRCSQEVFHDAQMLYSQNKFVHVFIRRKNELIETSPYVQDRSNENKKIYGQTEGVIGVLFTASGALWLTGPYSHARTDTLHPPSQVYSSLH